MNLYGDILEELYLLDSLDVRLKEEDLATKFNVGRSLVRCILSRLELEGLITRKKHSGISIVVPVLEDVVELYGIRSVIEKFAVSLACLKVDDACAKVLADLASGVQVCMEMGDHACRRKLDMDFHVMLGEMTGNRVIADPIRRCVALIRMFFTYRGGDLLMGGGGFNPTSHIRIAEAISQKNVARASFLIEKHCLLMQRYLVKTSGSVDAGV